MNAMYVLSKGEIARDLKLSAFNVFDVLKNQADFNTFITVAVCVVVYFCY